MTEISTINISDLVERRSIFDALRSWSGFVEVGAAAKNKRYKPWLQLDDGPNASWTWKGAIPDIELPPRGCSFLQNIEICGSGYIFSEGRVLNENAHTSGVALKRLTDPDYPDNLSVRDRPNRVVIDEPVLIVAGPGYDVFGHWLLDFLPRVVIAQELLGPLHKSLVLLLPSKTPRWVEGMLQTFCGIERNGIRYYSENEDFVTCRRVCLPSFAHNGNYSMHQMMIDFYGRFGKPVPSNEKRRICISRKSFSQGRMFNAREEMERLAAARGFEIVRPEELNFSEQASLFRSAECILGEHGSGLHGSVMSDPGTIVASVGFNWVQCHVSAAFEQPTIFMNRLQAIEDGQAGPRQFAADEGDLIDLLDKIDMVRNGEMP